MNSTRDFNATEAEEKKRPNHVLQEPLTFIILVWSLMLALVGICFAFTE
jgi:hypothetical protein